MKMKKGLFSKEQILRFNKSIAKHFNKKQEQQEKLNIFDMPTYLSFVVTPEERAIIEDALAKFNGRTMTEQLLCLIKEIQKKTNK